MNKASCLKAMAHTALLLLTCSSSMCGSADLPDAGNAHRAGITVLPAMALMHDRLTISVNGLRPDEKVVINARSIDQLNRTWSSSASFIARHDGSIDLPVQAPVSGTYSGANAMGLFSSMRPDASARPKPAFFAAHDVSKPVVTDIQVASERGVLARTRIVRRFARADVRVEPLRTNGIFGVLYRPANGSRKHRAIILLGGSEGGIPSPEGPLLASEGFLTLALAYFKADGLPATMQKIPVEYFGKAIRSIQALPDVQGPGVSIIGASRGGEAALIAASTYAEIDRVVAISASHVRWEGTTARELPGGPAWTYGGKPLPYIPFHISPGFAASYVWGTLTRGPVPLNRMFVDSLRGGETGDSQIPVERIRGPILLASGGDDRKWPSALMSTRAMERLRRFRHAYADEHVSYAGAGHWLPVVYMPTGGLQGRMAAEIGGTPEATAAVEEQFWPKVLRFLKSGGTPGLTCPTADYPVQPNCPRRRPACGSTPNIYAGDLQSGGALLHRLPRDSNP